ncbi:hypothetical protein AAC387_Pa01g4335 [Persea americana]
MKENRCKDLDFGFRVTSQATQMAICSLMARAFNFSCGNGRHEKRERERWYLKNGARLLQELIANCEGEAKQLQFFFLEELSKATNNFDKRHILCARKNQTTYEGSNEGRKIAIRQSDIHSEHTIDCVFNEIVMLSQINHRNVLRILGGCFETETPMPVFEFIRNESLYHHLHEKYHSSRMSWENRLRIATEVADAIAYLHTGATKPTVHQDIKSSNILLDEHYTAKVIDFELSIAIPLGETYVKSSVVGTVGSIDPHYSSTGRLTEKCDVYSFGVLLLELLTGKKTVERRDTGEDGGFLLVDFVISSIKENQLHLIFESSILKDSNMEQLMACAELAMKCIRWKPDERPTMKEVAQELRQIKKSSEDAL